MSYFMPQGFWGLVTPPAPVGTMNQPSGISAGTAWMPPPPPAPKQSAIQTAAGIVGAVLGSGKQPQQAAAAAAASGTPAWVLPVAIGAGVLVLVLVLSSR